jgi:sugar phosphate permease
VAERKGFFYGWVIIAIAWILYGFGISPAYYSWGQFGPTLTEDLKLSEFKFGILFSSFTFIYSATALLAAFLQARFSIRFTMTLGASLCAAGFCYMSRADTFLDCVIGFSVVGGIGIGLSTILPCQTLGQNWFLKYRATAIAIILTAGAFVGMAVPQIDKWFLENRSWNDGWLLIAGISATLAVVAFLFVRDRPEAIGLFRDGADEDFAPPTTKSAAIEAAPCEWKASQAVRTPQFALMILCGLAYATPWGVVVAFGRFHLEKIGLSSGVIAGIFSWMILSSIFGRFSASLGDLVSPKKVLAAALFIEAIGTLGLLFSTAPALGYVSVTLIGIGFGAGYVSISVVFAEFFGRRAFAGTSGTRMLIGGAIGFVPPPITGFISDRTGSYTIAFVALAILGLAGAVAAFLCRAPGAPPDAGLRPQ